MVLPGRDVPWKPFLKSVKDEWLNEDISNIAGALTFYGVLAIFPFLLFLVALASVIIDPSMAQVLVGQLREVAPEAVTQILGERLLALGEQTRPGLLTLGAVLALWAASSGVVSLMYALNTVYGVTESRSFLKVRGIAILTTVGAAALSVIAAFVMVAAPPIADAINPMLGTAVSWLRLPFSGLVMMFVWAMLYYVLPDVEQKFRFITPGSIIGVIIWLLASLAFSWYVRTIADYEASYGALGGVIVMLLWMWISSQVVLLGALVNAVLEHKSPEGKRVGAKSLADSGPSDSKAEREAKQNRPVHLPEPSTVGPTVPAPLPHRRALAIHREKPKERAGWLALGLAFLAGAMWKRT